MGLPLSSEGGFGDVPECGWEQITALLLNSSMKDAALCPQPCRGLSSISGLSLLDASSTLSSTLNWNNKQVTRHCHMPPINKIIPNKN